MGGALSCNQGHDGGIDETRSFTEWGYVGDGQGRFRKVTTYVDVGEGNGNFMLEDDEVVEGAGGPQHGGIPCLIALLVLGLVVVGIASVFQRGDHEKVQVKGGIAASAVSRSSVLRSSRSAGLALPRYVCGADAGRDSASDALKVLDGDHDGHISAEELHDCAHGTGAFSSSSDNRKHIRAGGSCAVRELARKLEDADLVGMGKGSMRYNELVTALAKVAARDVGSWSSAKRIWCCVHAGAACPSTSPAPTTGGHVVALAPPAALAEAPEPFDCSAGFNDWWRGWSQAKMDWCCTNYQRGCSSEASALAAAPPSATLPPC